MMIRCAHVCKEEKKLHAIAHPHACECLELPINIGSGPQICENKDSHSNFGNDRFM